MSAVMSKEELGVELPPGKWLRSTKTGVVHGYHKDMAKEEGYELIVVGANGKASNEGAELELSAVEKVAQIIMNMPRIESEPDLYTMGGDVRTDFLSKQLGEPVNAMLRDAAMEKVATVDVPLSAADDGEGEDDASGQQGLGLTE